MLTSRSAAKPRGREWPAPLSPVHTNTSHKMNTTMKRLRDEADQHMAGIIHDKLGSAVAELQRLHPTCEVTSIPVIQDGITIGYRFRVALRDGSSDAGSFTLPKSTKHIYNVIPW